MKVLWFYDECQCNANFDQREREREKKWNGTLAILKLMAG